MQSFIIVLPIHPSLAEVKAAISEYDGGMVTFLQATDTEASFEVTVNTIEEVTEQDVIDYVKTFLPDSDRQN